LKREKTGYIILIILAIIAITGMFILSPIEQNQSYHNFSDDNTIFNIPNFWNVVSNLPFMIVGFLGLYTLNTITKAKTQYFIFFLGIFLVSIGSGYYHLDPNDNTLVWDRLPMAIAFMALFSIVISEFISEKKGRLILFPILIVGLLSVLYWVILNDLSPYLLVQFYPMLAIPIILIFFRSKYNLTSGYWLLLFAYVIAKILEHFDYQVYSILELISGHSLKHIFASTGVFILFYTYVKRKRNA